jgi:hypothetical protein
MALTLDKTFTKPEILTRYLNLVSFGNGAYGIQDAAQTYFGIDASALNWQQSALLAGLVQSTSTLNPYTNPDGALAAKPGAGHHDREPARSGRRVAGGQARSRWASCRSPTSCRAAASPPGPGVLLRLRAGVPGPGRHQQGPDRQGRLSDQDHPGPRRAGFGEVGGRLARRPTSTASPA